MDVLDKDEFLKAYRSISAQLKRKFVRKPNITDAVESFGEVFISCVSFKFEKLI